MSKKSKKKKSKTIITSENIVVNTQSKVCNLFKTKPERSIGWIKEDGYDLSHPDNMNNLEKRVSYKLSRWAQGIVKLLEENGEMKNVDIMKELRKRGCNTSATHINEFFRSIDGKKFFEEQLIGNNGYWSLSFKNKSKTVSIPIMITQEMRIRLKGLKYSPSDIRYFTPEQAHDIIKNQIINKNPSLNHGRNQ